MDIIIMMEEERIFCVFCAKTIKSERDVKWMDKEEQIEFLCHQLKCDFQNLKSHATTNNGHLCFPACSACMNMTFSLRNIYGLFVHIQSLFDSAVEDIRSTVSQSHSQNHQQDGNVFDESCRLFRDLIVQSGGPLPHDDVISLSSGGLSDDNDLVEREEDEEDSVIEDNPMDCRDKETEPETRDEAANGGEVIQIDDDSSQQNLANPSEPESKEETGINQEESTDTQDLEPNINSVPICSKAVRNENTQTDWINAESEEEAQDAVQYANPGDTAKEGHSSITKQIFSDKNVDNIFHPASNEKAGRSYEGVSSDTQDLEWSINSVHKYRETGSNDKTLELDFSNGETEGGRHQAEGACNQDSRKKEEIGSEVNGHGKGSESVLNERGGAINDEEGCSDTQEITPNLNSLLNHSKIARNENSFEMDRSYAENEREREVGYANSVGKEEALCHNSDNNLGNNSSQSGPNDDKARTIHQEESNNNSLLNHHVLEENENSCESTLSATSDIHLTQEKGPLPIVQPPTASSPILCHLTEKDKDSGHPLNHPSNGSSNKKINNKSHNEVTVPKINEKTEKLVFRCDMCPNNFKSNVQLVLHYHNYHEQTVPFEKRSLPCPTCNKRFVTKFMHQRHVIGCKKNEDNKQSQSGFQDKDDIGVMRDVGRRRDNGGMRDNRASRKNGKRRDIRRSRDPNVQWEDGALDLTLAKKLDCRDKKCTESFSFEILRAIHERTTHPHLFIFKCKMCSKGYIEQSHMDTHIQTHEEYTGRLKCQVCNVDFTVKECLADHLFNHAGDEEALL